MGKSSPDRVPNFRSVTVGVRQIAFIAPQLDRSPEPKNTLVSAVLGGELFGFAAVDSERGVGALVIPQNPVDIKSAFKSIVSGLHELGVQKVEVTALAGQGILSTPNEEFRDAAMDKLVCGLEQHHISAKGRGWQEVQVEYGIVVGERGDIQQVPLDEEFDIVYGWWTRFQRVPAIAESLVRRTFHKPISEGQPYRTLRTNHPIITAYSPTFHVYSAQSTAA